MLKYTEADLNVKGVKIHYYRTGGNKPPFILMHGMSDNGLCWTPVAEVLSEKYDVIMPDAQGHGLSDRLDKNFTFQSHADQVIGLIKQLKVKKPLIMGHSMGAGTIVQIAVNQPTLPRAIILEDPAWMPSPLTSKNEDEVKKQSEGFVQYFSGLSRKTLPEVIAECRAFNPSWQEAEIKPWAESKLQFDLSLFSVMTMDPNLYKEFVPRIKCPALLIIAENGIVSREVAENAAKLWKSKKPFRWVQIKGATHNIRRDNFPAFRDAIFNFLESLPA